MKAEIKTKPVLLTDKNHIVALEAPCGTPSTALPDTCKPFEVLEPGMTEDANEKHLLLVEIGGLHATVEVNKIFHPMGGDHSTRWVCLTTKAGCTMRARLNSDYEPVTRFALERGGSPVAAYAHCNLHGLWKTNI